MNYFFPHFLKLCLPSFLGVLPFYLVHHLFFLLPLSSDFASVSVSVSVSVSASVSCQLNLAYSKFIFVMNSILTINQFCEARYPSTRDEPPALERSMLAIINTAQCLDDDLLHSRHICHMVILVRTIKYYFVSVNLRIILGSVKIFLLGVQHHLSIFLAPSAMHLTNRALKTQGQVEPEMADLIDEAMDVIQAAQKLHATACSSASIAVSPVVVGSSIPTAAPRELLVGGNEADWSDLPEIANIRREDRVHRLRQYIPFCETAYQALRAMEDAVLQKQLEENGMIKLDQARMEAIEKMRKDSRFLGRTYEVGQAFDGSHLKAHQCCYICQGIMGYVTNW